ncbi:RNase adapter RapZ [Streptomyces diastaticus]|uniref:RapZ C-terminal domain-containing protein n=1 Tax=Streptomyces diastaticus TaxID=1956 RepID=UPI0034020073
MQITSLPGTDRTAAVIRSIGIRHPGAHGLVTDGLYLDLTNALRNPAADPALRHATGLDATVRAHVLATPGAREVIARTVAQMLALAEEVPVHRLLRLTVACQGGRHRSVAVADEVAHGLWAAWGKWRGVDVEHHHVSHPVLASG